MSSSAIPSLKYSLAGSPVRFTNGTTATDAAGATNGVSLEGSSARDASGGRVADSRNSREANKATRTTTRSTANALTAKIRREPEVPGTRVGSGATSEGRVEWAPVVLVAPCTASDPARIAFDDSLGGEM